jgi:hypothetical protein
MIHGQCRTESVIATLRIFQFISSHIRVHLIISSYFFHQYCVRIQRFHGMTSAPPDTNNSRNTEVLIYTAEEDTYEDPPDDVAHVRVDSSVVEIPFQAFQNRQQLATVEFSQGLRIIGRDCFEGCQELTSISLPSITEIRSFAFAGCYKLENVQLPEGLQLLDTGAFVSCISMKNLRIPRSTHTIRNHAMAFCIRLTTLELPEGLTTISTRAFRQCISLMTVRIPSTVTAIKSCAFLDCKNMLSIEVAEQGLQRIEAGAFKNCEDLRSIYIPDTVTHMGANVFDGCTKLKEALPGDDEKLLNTLRNRFQDLPIHRLTYFHSYQDVDDNLDALTVGFSQEASGDAPPGTDAFGMTPLHLMALSSKPDLEVALYLVQRYSEYHVLEDRWGRLPVIYLCQSGPPNSVELVKKVARVVQPAIMETFHLEAWKKQMDAYIGSLEETDDCRARSNQIQRVLKIIDKYRTKEKLCSVELMLWKMKLQESFMESTEEEKRPKKRAKNNSGDSIPDPTHRIHCRMTCGAESVIANVVPFLGNNL